MCRDRQEKTWRKQVLVGAGAVHVVCRLVRSELPVVRSQKLFISGCRTVACGGDNQDDNKDEEDLEEHGDDTP